MSDKHSPEAILRRIVKLYPYDVDACFRERRGCKMCKAIDEARKYLKEVTDASR